MGLAIPNEILATNKLVGSDTGILLSETRVFFC